MLCLMLLARKLFVYLKTIRGLKGDENILQGIFNKMLKISKKKKNKYFFKYFFKYLFNICLIFIFQFHTHSGGSESIYKYVPQEFFPSDFGGKEKSINELQGILLNIVSFIFLFKEIFK